jgi:hypothetical protein
VAFKWEGAGDTHAGEERLLRRGRSGSGSAVQLRAASGQAEQKSYLKSRGMLSGRVCACARACVLG